MRYLLLLIALTLTGCSPPAQTRSTPSPAATLPATSLLTEPAHDSRHFGRMYTLGDMRLLAPMVDVKLDPGLNAEWANKNGGIPLTPKSFEHMLTTAKPVAPGHPQIDDWSYAPWYDATFVSAGRRWSVALYLGGRGVLTDDAGRKGAFDSDPPRAGGN